MNELGYAHDPIAPRRLRGLLLREWRAHGGRVLFFVSAFVVCQGVLLLFPHPGYLLGFGILYALSVAPAVAGLDAAEGTEEFTFSLPPTRGELYVVRVLFSGGLLALLLGAGWLALRYDLAQKMWGLVVESGFTEPYARSGAAAWGGGTVLIVPLALFCITFLVAASCTSRGAVGSAWLAGGLLTAAIGGGARLAGWYLLGSGSARIPLAALSVAGFGALAVGYGIFTSKEGMSRPSRGEAGSSLLAWVLAVFFLVFLLGVVSMYFFGAASVRSQ